MQPDSTLMERWQRQGDAQAFHELVTRHAPMVYATCVRVLRNATEAEDVAQECFELLAGWRKEAPRHLGAWLHRIAHNRCLDRVRAEKRRIAREKAYEMRRSDSVPAAWNDVYEHVDAAIAGLPEKLRGPLVAHFLENQTQAEIADALGVTRPAVSLRIKKGVEAVRKALKRKGISLAAPALALALAKIPAEALPVSLSNALGKIAVSGCRSIAAGAAAGASKGILAGMGTAKLLALALAVLLMGLVGLFQFHLLPGLNNVPPVPNAADRTAPPSTPTPYTSAAPVADTPPAPPKEPQTIIAGRVYDEETGAGDTCPCLCPHRKHGARRRFNQDRFQRRV